MLESNKKNHYLVYISQREGESLSWTTQWLQPEPLAEPKIPQITFNELQAQKIRKMKLKSDTIWEADHFFFAGGIIKDRGRPYFARALMLAHHESGFILFLHLIPHEAEHWHLRACAEYKEGAETWTDLAKYYHVKENWFNMFHAAKRALGCQLYKGLYLTEPDAYGWWPNDMAALSAYRLGYFKEALHHGQIAVDLNPDDQRLKDNLIWYKRALTGVTVVIPTKSNINGLTTLISVLMSSEGVSRVIVVGDGTETASMLNCLPSSIIKTYVPRGAGISAMWNHGMQFAHAGDHVLFLNDDVTINTSTVSGLVTALAEDSRIGLVCPKYAGDSDVDIISHSTCRGRYDGTGGMAGFAMMLASDLVPQFRFDERMMWWFSDDDLVNWVNKKANRLCVISAKARCQHAHSVTIANDPPKNFNEQVEVDRQIFNKKWNS